MRASSRPEEARLPAEVVAWYSVLLAGVVPALLLGFITSGLANRLSFAGWGLAMAVTYAALLRFGWQRRWRRSSLAAALLASVAGGLAIFALLVVRYREILDAGFRSHLPGLYHPLVTDSLAVLWAAGLLALPAAVLAGRSWLGARRPPVAGP